VAAAPVPSPEPAAPLPASVLTAAVATTILRTRLAERSATNTLPSASAAMPKGLLKPASVPMPLPLPPPARVVTAALDAVMARMRWLYESATKTVAPAVGSIATPIG